MKVLIGNVQGRLLPSPKNRLQYFPKLTWRKEFQLANQIGFDFIEFFSERIYNKSNPIWHDALIVEYKELCKKNNLKIFNFCDDYIISNNLDSKNYNKYFFSLIKNCKNLGIKNLILPLYGKSNLNLNNFNKFIAPLKRYNEISKNNKIKLLIETNLEIKYLIPMFKKINSNNFRMLYDTGNRIINKNNNYDDIIKLSHFIGHIHIKDKTINNKNVIIGNGDVNFDHVFKNLKKINYNKNFTFETNKGDNPLKTSINNLKFIKKMINKYK